MVLEAPPLNTYTSCEQGLQDLYNWSQEQGYGLTIEGTNQTKKKVIKRYRLLRYALDVTPPRLPGRLPRAGVLKRGVAPPQPCCGVCLQYPNANDLS